MTEEQGLSVMDLLKPQIPLTSLGMEVVGKNSSRDLPLQEDVAPHFMLKKNTKDTFSYFGIDLDKENAFLETIPLRNAILSLNCINKNFTSASSSTSPSKELKQRHVLARLPVENPEKLINHIIQNDNIKIPKKVLTKMVLSLSPSKGLILPSVHEAKTPEKFYNGNDILDCHSSPWPHLDEDQYHSLRPDRSPKKCSGNGMYNKMQSPKPSFVVNQQNQEKLLECKHQDADVSSLIIQNQNRSDGIKSASKDKTLNILQHIDDEEPSQNEVPSFSVVFPSGSADSVVVSADDGTMGNIASSTETKDCSSNTLLQQGHAAVTDLNKNLKHNCSSINLNGNVSSKQTLNVGKIPREGSVTDSVHMKTNDSTVNDVTQDMTDEEDLNQSMCNMSVHEKFNLTNDSNKTDIFIVLDETVDDDSNNSTNEITKKKHDDSLDNNSKMIFLYNKEEVPCFSKSQSGSVEGLVKPYLQPFVSKDPQENKDNEVSVLGRLLLASWCSILIIKTSLSLLPERNIALTHQLWLVSISCVPSLQ
ncbi:uncharacterized protein LOC121871558 [Homarus americanus]|uniref:uncharacterized protein LOC121871558 n=1 Tax=Homarus americanus TaxID=6706 RepID=UPI001C4908DC|nr:uncharacterized protein LOC121871558 [Homarus americanus]